LVFAERVARALRTAKKIGRTPAARLWKVPPLPDRGAAQVAADAIRAVMWEDAGIVRTARGLHDALTRLDEIRRRLPPGATEELNMLQTAELVAEAALKRKESRGGHYRADHPRARGNWKGRHIEL
jgi:L-aspartate oxidase